MRNAFVISIVADKSSPLINWSNNPLPLTQLLCLRRIHKVFLSGHEAFWGAHWWPILVDNREMYVEYHGLYSYYDWNYLVWGGSSPPPTWLHTIIHTVNIDCSFKHVIAAPRIFISASRPLRDWTDIPSYNLLVPLQNMLLPLEH